ncbi:aminoacyl-tRNA deacylase [Alkaliflexus imshenetskii]|uniref:aminoacyl-tRNA deacylase n=1 Tax=Alkaliflexus imshenetskii TaxID=286730 RepID=UPI00047D15F5|nr:YbaK/EbsC family protein [Alkaliflexus imshenetskii]
MPLQALKEYLEKNGVRYTNITHSKAYTMQSIAALTHISGKKIAKTVMVVVDGKMSMAVLPASTRINFSALKEALGATDVHLARENEFKDIFPNCEVGAMPPFGNLWNIPVYVAESLTDQENIAFNAGNHSELTQMSFRDYERLVHPQIFKYSYAQRKKWMA